MNGIPKSCVECLLWIRWLCFFSEMRKTIITLQFLFQRKYKMDVKKKCSDVRIFFKEEKLKFHPVLRCVLRQQSCCTFFTTSSTGKKRTGVARYRRKQNHIQNPRSMFLGIRNYGNFVHYICIKERRNKMPTMCQPLKASVDVF